MTLLEKAKVMGETILKDAAGQYAEGCPYKLGLESYEDSMNVCTTGPSCADCYAREYKGYAEKSTEKSSMRTFDTGAVRDDATGKGRFDLLPWAAIHALAKHCERGALHYGERNVDKGIPQHSLIDSGVRHLALYIQGDAEPHHLVAALWNIAWAVEQEIKRPHLVDLPEREGVEVEAV